MKYIKFNKMNYIKDIKNKIYKLILNYRKQKIKNLYSVLQYLTNDIMSCY